MFTSFFWFSACKSVGNVFDGHVRHLFVWTSRLNEWRNTVDDATVFTWCWEWLQVTPVVSDQDHSWLKTCLQPLNIASITEWLSQIHNEGSFTLRKSSCNSINPKLNLGVEFEWCIDFILRRLIIKSKRSWTKLLCRLFIAPIHITICNPSLVVWCVAGMNGCSVIEVTWFCDVNFLANWVSILIIDGVAIVISTMIWSWLSILTNAWHGGQIDRFKKSITFKWFSESLRLCLLILAQSSNKDIVLDRSTN